MKAGRLRFMCAAMLLGLCISGTRAYVGEFAKDAPDGTVPGLAPLIERQKAYSVLNNWRATARPEDPMTGAVLKAYHTLRDGDETVMMFTHQQFLDRVLNEIRSKLPEVNRERIDGYHVVVTAAAEGVARVDRSARWVLIPVDFLHDVYVATMALQEFEDQHSDRYLEELGAYLAFRLNPGMRAKWRGRTFFAMGFTQAVTGEYWRPSREHYNEAFNFAYAATRGAALHQALHELCHVIAQHKDYGEISEAGAISQEQEADECAFRLMPDTTKEYFFPAGAVLVLTQRSFDAAGAPISSSTHPPALCRAQSLAFALYKIRDLKQELSKTLNRELPGHAKALRALIPQLFDGCRK